MNYVAGIDIGTGSVKAVAVDLTGRPIDACNEYYEFNAPNPGYHEQEPEQIFLAFKKVLHGLIDKLGQQPLGIGLSSAMHSIMPVDDTGYALAPMITWADTRSSNIAERLRWSKEGGEIYLATGTPIHAMSPLCKLIWIKENDPTLFAKAYKFISIKEYIWYQLFKEYKVDHSIASCTGLYNIHELFWNEKSLQLAGISELHLSQPVETNYTKPYEGNMLPFLEMGIPITIGASDGCLANLGSAAHQAGTVAITIGTSGAARVANAKPIMDISSMPFSYILDKETYVCGGPINNGGIALQWWMKNSAQSVFDELDYEHALSEIARIPPGCEGLIFLPYLTGERAPIWDSESCGVFFGMRLVHTNAHFLRAVLEGICFAMNDVLYNISKQLSFTSIHVSGGFVKSPQWLQMLADITGKSLILVQPEDASASGAALMAMKATGLIEKYPELDRASAEIIKPDPENERHYSRYFPFFQQLYKDLKQAMKNFQQLRNSNI
jgi:gluconokinase